MDASLPIPLTLPTAAATVKGNELVVIVVES
jgi:hypothetical protein